MATNRYFKLFCYESPFSRAARLADLGAEVLVCGTVSDAFANMIKAHGIRIIPFVSGAVDKVLDAYLVSERKLGFFVRIKEDEDFNRMNILSISRTKI
ncbi:MAG: NifB/NifX family molybdenum-iron cluster-binding protein [Thermodesulfobacteriota bacterium]|nr:NifB/NifX family molybdenum-iron cluster-binding protein [Thermodesulfobacteriota bacterium]